MKKDYLNILTEKIRNKEDLILDLKNGVIVNLTYDEKIKAYRGYIEELDMKVGIWKKESLIKMVKGEFGEMEFIL